MPIYQGKGVPDEPGFEMKEFRGMFVNPDNPDEWSSKPYPSQIKDNNIYNDVMDYMNGRFTLQDVYEQIKVKICPLSTSRRQFVLDLFDEHGNFKETN